jgi:glutathione S-transferase
MPKLYSNLVCPFAHRSRLALTLKQVAYECVEVELKDMPQWYKDISPNHSVPLLENEGRRIWESAIIDEYVDEAFEGPALLPKDPYLRARARLAIDWVGAQLLPMFYKAMRGQLENVEEELDRVRKGLEETMVGDGRFWLGAEPSLADVAIYPWFEREAVLKHYHGIEISTTPRLKQWKAAMEALPAVQRERHPAEAYISAYARYAPAPVS